MRAACYPHPLCSILVTLTAREPNRLSGTCWRSTSRLSYRLPRWQRISGVAPGVHTLQVDWTDPSSAIPCHHVVSGVIRASVPAWCDGRGAPAEGRCVDHCAPAEVQAGGMRRPTSDWAQLTLCNQIIPARLVFSQGLCGVTFCRPDRCMIISFVIHILWLRAGR